MVTKKKTKSKNYRSFIGILLGICLITIPAVTALAKGEDTDKQVVQTNPEILEELEKQGGSTKKEETETSIDTNEQNVELASASAVKLNSEVVGETSSYNEIIFNEKIMACILFIQLVRYTAIRNSMRLYFTALQTKPTRQYIRANDT